MQKDIAIEIENEPRPIFIVGCPRSGTSWTWGLLISHPDVEPLLIEDFPGIITNSGVEKMKLAEGFRTTETTVFFSNLSDEEIRDAVIRKQTKNFRKTLVEKTPSNILKLDRIISLFPDAKIIHIIRDPRATINSILKTEFSTGFKFARDLKHAIGIYRQHHECGKKFENYKNLIRVRYEDLFVDPKETYRKIINFCGLKDIEDAEIEKIFFENKNRAKTVQKGIFRKGRIDSYLQEMEVYEIQTIEERLNDIIHECCYG